MEEKSEKQSEKIVDDEMKANTANEEESCKSLKSSDMEAEDVKSDNDNSVKSKVVELNGCDKTDLDTSNKEANSSIDDKELKNDSNTESKSPKSESDTKNKTVNDSSNKETVESMDVNSESADAEKAKDSDENVSKKISQKSSESKSNNIDTKKNDSEDIEAMDVDGSSEESSKSKDSKKCNDSSEPSSPKENSSDEIIKSTDSEHPKDKKNNEKDAEIESSSEKKPEKELKKSNDESDLNEKSPPSTPKSRTSAESKAKDVSVSDKKKKKKDKTCEECRAKKGLKFQVMFQGKTHYLCSDVCYQGFKNKQKSAKPSEEPKPSPEIENCGYCKKVIKKEAKGFYPTVGEVKSLCSEECLLSYQESNAPKKKCSQCKVEIVDDLSCLTWETMEFCNEDCLGKYQSFLGSHCTCCQSPVQQTSLGKYCVCFGADIRQFCSGTCLEEFKKGLKVCSYCQKDLSNGSEGFLAPVGDKGMFKDFCTQQCMERYEAMNSNNASSVQNQNQKCSFCDKSGNFKIKTKHGDKPTVLCSENCVAGFRHANKIIKKMCDTCYKFFDIESNSEFMLQFEGKNKYYCSKPCMTLFVLSHRKIVPCTWCKVKKYNFDMIEKLESSNQTQTYCSLNCISLYRVSVNATSAKSIRCDSCSKNLPAQYHLTMSDGSIRNFCTYPCVISFQNQFTNAPTLTTSSSSSRQSTTTVSSAGSKTTSATATPVISNVMSLANPRSPAPTLSSKLVPQKLVSSSNVRQASPSVAIITTKSPAPLQTINTPTSSVTTGTNFMKEVIVKPPAPKSMKNKSVLCRPIMQTKGVSCKPHPCHKAVQTEESSLPSIIPIPIPIYVPTPVHMFSRPVPCPVPFPVPVPIPIFIPTTKDSPLQILKQLKDIQEKIPSNPFEAEMLMMAEMVAEKDDKKGESANDVSSSENCGDTPQTSKVDSTEVSEAALDVETDCPSGIAPLIPKEPDNPTDEDYVVKEGRKRSARGRGRGKRARVDIPPSGEELDSFSSVSLLDDQNPAHHSEQTDSSMRLKYTFGVNAWKHWVLQKNAQLEKGSHSSRKIKLFKTDLLQLPPDELNYSLCLFVKEVRKPSGEEYAPASIYYLCLGIQQFLFENGRIDNIFTDPYYEKFTECLNDVLQNQEDVMTSEGYYVSKVEEEVLWESKQLGAHSPHVLLNTLMYFNTKYFNLKAVDDHIHLSFSHITKHWRKTPLKAGPRSVILRYYPPTNREWQSRKVKEEPSMVMYEQNENLESPLRCPVKLYEFYFSKCPESVKTRNDVFYLYPERSCVPDSPVWYSTQALGQDMISKMLQRIKTVREVFET